MQVRRIFGCMSNRELGPGARITGELLPAMLPSGTTKFGRGFAMLNTGLRPWSRTTVFQAAVIAIALAAATGGTAAAEPAVEIPAKLDGPAIQLYSEKLDTYAGLVAGSARLVTDAMRYMGSFDLKKGPTGKDGSVYELIDIDG